MHTRSDTHFLELKIPPVPLVIIFTLAMWVGGAHAPAFNFKSSSQLIAALGFGLLGLIIGTLGILEFKRAKTTVNPTKPRSASSLVRTGIYRHTRNPMYLSFLLIMSGWATLTANILASVMLPAFSLYEPIPNQTGRAGSTNALW